MVRSRPLSTRLALLLMALAVGGGRAAGPPPSPAPAEPATTGSVWQRVRFRIPLDKDPKWHLDGLVAHRVVAPVLARERASITLWRFHRRAYADDAGHSLSFLTYAPRPVNATLCRSLTGDSFVAELTRAGFLNKVECESWPADTGHLVEATSDTSWSPAIQRAWPYYIMGVSEMWLRIVDEHARTLPPGPPPTTLPQVVAHYDNVHRSVSLAWGVEGEHAFLHHLNALFGYEPIRIAGPQAFRF